MPSVWSSFARTFGMTSTQPSSLAGMVTNPDPVARARTRARSAAARSGAGWTGAAASHSAATIASGRTVIFKPFLPGPA